MSISACAGEVWTEDSFNHALFQGWGVGSKVLLEQVQLNFSFRKKFIILHPCGLLVDNRFSKMCVLKSLTSYTDYGGYETEMMLRNITGPKGGEVTRD